MRYRTQRTLALSTLEELLQLAKRFKIPLKADITRNKLLSLVRRYFQANSPKKTKKAPKSTPKISQKKPPSYSPLRERLRKKAQDKLRSPFDFSLMDEVAPNPQDIYIDLGMPIPDTYQDDFLELMPITPNRVYAYWELSSPEFSNIQDQFGRLTPLVLKLTNLSTQKFEIFEVPQTVNEFYFQATPQQQYKLTLYLLAQQGELHFLLESDIISTSATSPAAEKPGEWLNIEENFRGELKVEPGVLLETEKQTAVFVPTMPQQQESNMPVKVVAKKKSSGSSEPFAQKPVARNFMPQVEAAPFTPSFSEATTIQTPTTLVSPTKTEENLTHELAEKLAQNPENFFPGTPSEVLLYQNEMDPKQTWIQEKTGERWFWVSTKEKSFSKWVHEHPVHWVEGEEGAWIHFAQGSGPEIKPGKVTWFSGNRDGKTWYFQQGETVIQTHWLPKQGHWEEITPPIRWIQGELQEGTLVLVDEPEQQFFVKIIEEPYLVIGSSESHISSHSWGTSFGVPRWRLPVSSASFPVSSQVKIPTSGAFPVTISSYPQIKRFHLAPSSWSYPVSRPEVSSWIFPRQLKTEGKPKVGFPITSRPYNVSSWSSKSWPVSSWTQPYLRWVNPDEFWKRPVLNWPTSSENFSSWSLPRTNEMQGGSVEFESIKEETLTPEQQEKLQVKKIYWKPIPAKQKKGWQLPKLKPETGKRKN